MATERTGRRYARKDPVIWRRLAWVVMGCDPSIGIHDLPDCGAPCYDSSLVLHISKRLSPPRRSPPQTRTGGGLFCLKKNTSLGARQHGLWIQKPSKQPKDAQ